MNASDFDLAIVGSGFGGSLLAMIARRLGLSVILLERGQHPRFAIGESSTPLANLLLEELSQRYDLPRLKPLTKWGPWQRSYPEIGCGLKRGFSFFHHRLDCPFLPEPEHGNQLLVAASSSNEVADTHWYRPDFDHFFVRDAQALGSEYLDQTVLQPPQFEPNSVRLLGTRLGQPVSIRARFLVDGTGPRGFLHNALQLPEVPFDHLPPTHALFTHFKGVRRLEDIGVIPEGQRPPFPIDDAALHHVFNGGWIWVLRFNNGVTSAGVAAKKDLANALQFDRGSGAWHQLLKKLPTVAQQFEHATEERPFTHMSKVSFQSGRIVGPRWALLPSAAGFIDPLLSTGFTLTLLGVCRLALALEREWHAPHLEPTLEAYARITRDELLAVERLVSALYANMSNPSVFASLTLLYFAAVSFAEITKRTKQTETAPSFLLHADPEFGPKFKMFCAEALRLSGVSELSTAEQATFRQQIIEAIAPIDLIGLRETHRQNWHPCERTPNDPHRGR